MLFTCFLLGNVGFQVFSKIPKSWSPFEGLKKHCVNTKLTKPLKRNYYEVKLQHSSRLTTFHAHAFVSLVSRFLKFLVSLWECLTFCYWVHGANIVCQLKGVSGKHHPYSDHLCYFYNFLKGSHSQIVLKWEAYIRLFSENNLAPEEKKKWVRNEKFSVSVFLSTIFAVGLSIE